MTSPPPLAGIRVLEFAGLAPGPFAGLLLVDYGATVVRIDRPHPSAHASDTPLPTPDLLARGKTSIVVDIKTHSGVELLKSLVPFVDVIIDPFRPGMLEKAGLSPEEVLLPLNRRLIIGRLTGFRRDGKYSQMAGHDINYIAVSGVLSILGPHGQKPLVPGNLIGDFAGGGLMCFVGIVLALFHRERTGFGQVVEANMVDGSAYLATFPRIAAKTPLWNRPRGANLLDGGCPYYNTYETKDGGFMSVGALEPQFFAALLKGLGILPSSLTGPREDPQTWPAMDQLFTKTFKTKTRVEWEEVFAESDGCCLPVVSQFELQEDRPPVTLKSSPANLVSTHKANESSKTVGLAEHLLVPGSGGEEVLKQWTGWEKGEQYGLENGGLVKLDDRILPKL